MINNIKKRIDDYLEFDSELLFKSTDYLEIFGGAIRDSIANLKIHDIDILCMKNSALKASDILKNNGYKNVTNKLSTKDIQQMYKETHFVFEPWTFMNSNLKIVQLIRPVSGNSFINFDMNYHETIFYKTIKNVDISCCGVSWDGIEIKEYYKDAITHCKLKIFTINENAGMYSKNRIFDRKYKLINRGWVHIDMNDIEYNAFIRKQKILNLNK